MCVSTAACGKSDESGKKDDTEEKVTTTAAAVEESEEADGASESKAEGEEPTSESKADESEATEPDSSTDSLEPTLTLDDFEAIAKEIANVNTIEEAEKIVTEKLPVDVSSKEVFEFTKEKNGFDGYSIGYDLQPSMNIFGNIDGINDPMPPVDHITISSSTKGSKLEKFSFSMTETSEKELEYSEKNDLYDIAGFDRSQAITFTFYDALDDKYGESQYNDDYAYGFIYWSSDGLPFFVEDTSHNGSDSKTYSISYNYNTYYIEE